MNITMNTNKTKLYLCRNNFIINRLNARILLKIEYNLAFFYLLTLSLRAFPALKAGVVAASILISSPVCGFLPVLAALSLVL